MIVLIGFMGAGKSTVGPKLAAELGLSFIDTDVELERRFGISISQFFQVHGESAFRQREAEFVLQALAETDSVIALGGGSVLDPQVVVALGSMQVIYLRASFAEIRRRLKSDMDRPLLQYGDVLELYKQRCQLYERIANVSFDTDGCEPDDLVRTIAAWVAPPHGAPDHPTSALSTQRSPAFHETASISVELGRRSYDIHIGSGLLERIAETYPARPEIETVFVIGDEGVSEYSKSVAAAYEAKGKPVRLFELPGAEGSKSLAHVESLLASLAAAPAHRRDLVVTVGGGVMSDLGGFVASIYARGLDVIHCPTTLLGQVDAAIGGKTGVNLSAGKNLVGTIHQPRAVICDTVTLRTLPEEELRSGMAEVLKYGFIADPELLTYAEANAAAISDRDQVILGEIVRRSALIKAKVVSADEIEEGERAHLNYGHTFAHALELQSGFGALRHGEAVALGMMAAAFVSNEMGWLDDPGVVVHEKALATFDLPVAGSLVLEDLEAAWEQDKKYERGVRFVLLEALGRPRAGVRVEREVLVRALERMNR